ncbi:MULTISPECIES: MMPL family transporter [unclassified Streptomyces]|uniref:MMPL family transporter n=1 Tax=unclassified Streptomyces TaxID=2593676 RepID=UPI0037F2839C
MRLLRGSFIGVKLPLLIVVVWLAAGVSTAGFPFRLGSAATQRPSATLPADAESSRVAEELEAGSEPDGLPVVLVWDAVDRTDRTGRHSRTLSESAARRALSSLPASLASSGPVTASRTGRSLLCVVTLNDPDEARLGATLERIRRAARTVPGSRVELAGPAPAQVDLTASFEGIDGRLLAITLIMVGGILMWVYRSLLMPLVVIASGVLALTLSSAALYAMQARGWVAVDGQTQGILSVLVIGATTDYGLLLLSRYREFAQSMPRAQAMRVAWAANWAPITASGATVACAMAALLFSGLPSNRSLAPAGAVAMGCCVLSALTFVPAAALLGARATPGPREPHHSRRSQRIWSYATEIVGRRTRAVWLLGLTALAGCAALAGFLAPLGVPLAQALGAQAPSVRAQSAVEAHFPAGTGSPLIILTSSSAVQEVRERIVSTKGVAEAQVIKGAAPAASRAVIQATLDSAPDSERAQQTVERVRQAASAVRSQHADVGGYPAQVHDLQKAAQDDELRVMPAVLIIVVILLAALLRSLALPLLLAGAAVANFLAALGISAVIFRLAYGSALTEPSLILFSFVFLIALGVDYNIFLMHRVREESLSAGHRSGTLRGVTATGGVISSAGVILAATFAALTVMPLRYLVQIGIIIAVGILLDTLFVRLLLLPALVLEAGPRLWWPTRLPSVRHPFRPGEVQPQTAATTSSTPLIRR